MIKEAKLGLEPQEIEQYWTKLKSYIDRINNEDLRNFVAEQFARYEDLFKVNSCGKTYAPQLYWRFACPHC